MPVVINKRLLDVKDAAQYLSIGCTMLREWIKTKKIPCIRLNSKILLDVEELDEFVNELKKRRE